MAPNKIAIFREVDPRIWGGFGIEEIGRSKKVCCKSVEAPEKERHTTVAETGDKWNDAGILAAMVAVDIQV
jgi:hypothetical protein